MREEDLDLHQYRQRRNHLAGGEHAHRARSQAELYGLCPPKFRCRVQDTGFRGDGAVKRRARLRDLEAPVMERRVMVFLEQP